MHCKTFALLLSNKLLPVGTDCYLRKEMAFFVPPNKYLYVAFPVYKSAGLCVQEVLVCHMPKVWL